MPRENRTLEPPDGFDFYYNGHLFKLGYMDKHTHYIYRWNPGRGWGLAGWNILPERIRDLVRMWQTQPYAGMTVQEFINSVD